MAATTGHDPTSRSGRIPSSNGVGRSIAPADWHDGRYQAFMLMRLAFTVAPIAFGLDKFFNVMVDWPIYLAPWIDDIAPGSGQDCMYFVGVTEIAAGVLVALKPRYGGYVVAGWLAGIVLNLVTHPGFYDIALRDFGLMLAALTLARLASVYDPPLRSSGRGRAQAGAAAGAAARAERTAPTASSTRIASATQTSAKPARRESGIGSR